MRLLCYHTTDSAAKRFRFKRAEQAIARSLGAILPTHLAHPASECDRG
ncbi:hypothetical protein RMSM_06065 [Rhodopirellula maiorica SM1]|uniref:Uncharacterized protein n=1 Tax=Rhodopirellula maiorica SM1 TaxID=1265738 RepID=M5RNP4_9BACT|nr:hypothetical protein RMSM_06065 [Rhodopirellula maiorica SM1]